MGQKKAVRQEDIAQELGISTVSVSNALKGSPGVSRELRMQIQKKAQELGYEYIPSAVRREMRRYSIGVVIAEQYVNQFPSFYMDVYKQVAQAAGKRGNVTILKVIGSEVRDKADLACLFENVEIQGIIVIGEVPAEFVEGLGRFPVVCVDFYSRAVHADCIVSDNLHGMQRVTESLIKEGHRDIAFWGDPYASCRVMDRYMGYCKALRKNGLWERRGATALRQAGEGGTERFALPDKLPTAFVCGSDRDAYGLIRKLRKQGLSVPVDISVAGYGNIRCPGMDGIFLSTYEIDEKTLAEISVDTLMKKLSGTNDPDKKGGGIQMVQGRLVKGNTVRSRRML